MKDFLCTCALIFMVLMIFLFSMSSCLSEFAFGTRPSLRSGNSEHSLSECLLCDRL